MYVSLCTAAVRKWQRRGSVLENQDLVVQQAASEFTYVQQLLSILEAEDM
jgi:hypothetical protein